MARQRTMYNIVGRYVDEADARSVVGYHINSLDGGKGSMCTCEQLAFLIGREQIANCDAQIYKDRVLFKGKGIALDSLPTKKIAVKKKVKTDNEQQPVKQPIQKDVTEQPDASKYIKIAELSKQIGTFYCNRYKLAFGKSKCGMEGNCYSAVAAVEGNIGNVPIRMTIQSTQEPNSSSVNKLRIRLAKASNGSSEVLFDESTDIENNLNNPYKDSDKIKQLLNKLKHVIYKLSINKLAELAKKVSGIYANNFKLKLDKVTPNIYNEEESDVEASLLGNIKGTDIEVVVNVSGQPIIDIISSLSVFVIDRTNGGSTIIINDKAVLDKASVSLQDEPVRNLLITINNKLNEIGKSSKPDKDKASLAIKYATYVANKFIKEYGLDKNCKNALYKEDNELVAVIDVHGNLRGNSVIVQVKTSQEEGTQAIKRIEINLIGKDLDEKREFTLRNNPENPDKDVEANRVIANAIESLYNIGLTKDWQKSVLEKFGNRIEQSYGFEGGINLYRTDVDDWYKYLENYLVGGYKGKELRISMVMSRQIDEDAIGDFIVRLSDGSDGTNDEYQGYHWFYNEKHSASEHLTMEQAEDIMGRLIAKIEEYCGSEWIKYRGVEKPDGYIDNYDEQILNKLFAPLKKRYKATKHISRFTDVASSGGLNCTINNHKLVISMMAVRVEDANSLEYIEIKATNGFDYPVICEFNLDSKETEITDALLKDCLSKLVSACDAYLKSGDAVFKPDLAINAVKYAANIFVKEHGFQANYDAIELNKDTSSEDTWASLNLSNARCIINIRASQKIGLRSLNRFGISAKGQGLNDFYEETEPNYYVAEKDNGIQRIIQNVSQLISNAGQSQKPAGYIDGYDELILRKLLAPLKKRYRAKEDISRFTDVSVNGALTSVINGRKLVIDILIARDENSNKIDNIEIRATNGIIDGVIAEFKLDSSDGEIDSKALNILLQVLVKGCDTYLIVGDEALKGGTVDLYEALSKEVAQA